MRSRECSRSNLIVFSGALPYGSRDRVRLFPRSIVGAILTSSAGVLPSLSERVYFSPSLVIGASTMLSLELVAAALLFPTSDEWDVSPSRWGSSKSTGSPVPDVSPLGAARISCVSASSPASPLLS